MTIIRQSVRYDHAGKTYESLAIWDDATPAVRPMVLVAPSFMGRTALEQEKGEALAKMGYAAFVIDIYGVDVKPANHGEAAAAMQPLNDDRAALTAMMQAALAEAAKLDVTDTARVAAIGFCFGGKCVLDLARQDAPVRGVVTFHGIFDQPGIAVADSIGARVLALHGWDDPLATPDDVTAFAAEMTAKKADWQLHAYGHTGHAFTNYNRPESFRDEADRRSWQAMANFLAEIFG